MKRSCKNCACEPVNPEPMKESEVSLKQIRAELVKLSLWCHDMVKVEDMGGTGKNAKKYLEAADKIDEATKSLDYMDDDT